MSLHQSDDTACLTETINTPDVDGEATMFYDPSEGGSFITVENQDYVLDVPGDTC